MKVPLALKPTWPCELVGALAVAGVTVMLVIVGCPAPHPMNTVVVMNKVKRAVQNCFIWSLEPETLLRVAELGVKSRQK